MLESSLVYYDNTLNMVDSDEIYRLHTELCKAFTNPVRLKILNELRGGEKSVSQLCSTLSFSQSGISQHLSVLHKAGVVVSLRSGNVTYYSLRDRRLIKAFDTMRNILAEMVIERDSVLYIKGE